MLILIVAVITFCYYYHDFQIPKSTIIPSSKAAFHMYGTDTDIGLTAKY